MKRALLTLVFLAVANVASGHETDLQFSAPSGARNLSGATGAPHDLSLSTSAGRSADFTQKYTVTGVPICDD